MRKEADIKEGRRGINNRETAVVESIRIILITSNEIYYHSQTGCQSTLRVILYLVNSITELFFVIRLILLVHFLNMTNKIKFFLADVILF